MTDITIETNEDWNQGELDSTTADSNDEDGNLKIGYPSGRNDIDTTMPGYDDLIGQFRLDEDDIQDASTVERNLSVSGSPTQVSDNLLGSNVREFESGDVVEIVEDDDILNPTGDFTAAIWLNTTTGQIGTESETFIFSVNEGGSGGASNITWMISIDNGEPLRFTVGPSESSGNGADVQSTWDDGEWHLVVGTWNDSEETSTVYFDGEEEDVRTTDQELRSNDDAVASVGGHPASGREDRSFEGKLSNAMFFDRRLSEEEIQELYFNGHTGDNFEGEYASETFEPEEGEDVEHSDIEVTADIGEDASAEIKAVALDGEEEEIDSTTISIDDGTNTYDISDLDDSPKIQFESTHEVDIS